MLEIKPIEEKREQQNICRLCGIPYRPECFAYKAYEGETLIASAQFDIEGTSAVLFELRQVTGSPEDFEAMFILGRAVLNFLDLCGVQTARFPVDDEASARLAKAIGFREEEGVLRICLTGMFTSHCHPEVPPTEGSEP